MKQIIKLGSNRYVCLDSYYKSDVPTWIVGCISCVLLVVAGVYAVSYTMKTQAQSIEVQPYTSHNN